MACSGISESTPYSVLDGQIGWLNLDIGAVTMSRHSQTSPFSFWVGHLHVVVGARSGFNAKPLDSDNLLFPILSSLIPIS